MKDDLEICQAVYDIFKMWIQFGVYQCGDILPAMEQAAGSFLVSLGTIRSAYLRLQHEGYVKLSTNVGTMVIKNYDKQDIENCIQLFFGQRKNALIDLSKSMRPLLGHAQWVGLINTPAKVCNETQPLETNNEMQPLIAFKHIIAAYNSLGNDLLLRLLWQIFTFFEAPFFSIREDPWCKFAVNEYAPQTLEFFLKKHWVSLRKSFYDAQDSLARTMDLFYGDRITTPSPLPEIPFMWSSYKKASQIRYSLAMELLTSISRGQYPENTLLPSLNKLAEERNVSVSTVRRALALLNGIGATKSYQRIGTKVLPSDETAKHCDFSKPVIHRRLLDMAQSLQILTLSCKSVSEVTIMSLDSDGLQKCRERLIGVRERGQYELITYTTLELLEQFAPYQTIRTVYGELLRQLFWGHALHSMCDMNDDKVNFFLCCFDSFIHSLEKADAACFSDKLEELMLYEFRFTINNLIQLGIQEVEGLLVPDIL